jgi:hypothetical protein
MFDALIIVFRLLTDPDRLCESLIFPAVFGQIIPNLRYEAALLLRRKRCSLKKCCKDSGGI